MLNRLPMDFYSQGGEDGMEVQQGIQKLMQQAEAKGKDQAAAFARDAAAQAAGVGPLDEAGSVSMVCPPCEPAPQDRGGELK